MRVGTLSVALLALYVVATSQAQVSGSDKKTISSPDFPKALGAHSQGGHGR
jgi:hypothetical protein